MGTELLLGVLLASPSHGAEMLGRRVDLDRLRAELSAWRTDEPDAVTKSEAGSGVDPTLPPLAHPRRGSADGTLWALLAAVPIHPGVVLFGLVQSWRSDPTLYGVLPTAVAGVTLGWAGAVFPSLFKKKRWAWAMTMGLTFAKCLTPIAAAVAALFLPGRVLLILGEDRLMLAGSYLALVGIWLFRGRAAFGVGAREAWSTLMREGWWAMLLTAIPEAAYLLSQFNR